METSGDRRGDDISRVEEDYPSSGRGLHMTMTHPRVKGVGTMMNHRAKVVNDNNNSCTPSFLILMSQVRHKRIELSRLVSSTKATTSSTEIETK